MKLFPNCTDCFICFYGNNGCYAGIGDDNFIKATKEQLLERIDEYTNRDKDFYSGSIECIVTALKEWYDI